MKKIFLLSIFAAVLLCSCATDNEIVNDNTFDVTCDSPFLSGDVFSFGPGGGQAVLSLTTSRTSVPWKIRCGLDDYWCSYTMDDESVTLDISGNDEGRRETYFEIVVGENIRRYTILQDYTPRLECENPLVSVKHSGSNCTVKLSTNIADSELSVSNPSDWITDVQIRRGVVSFNVKGYQTEEPDPRTCNLRISYEGLFVDVEVSQVSPNRPPVPSQLPEGVWKPETEW